MNMRVILPLMLLYSASTLGAPCKVYGISDSPQSLECSFPGRNKVSLKCKEGKYLLDKSPVTLAFHLEVESGTVPLVFKALDETLTVLLNDPIEAELTSGMAELRGKCKKE